MKTEHGWNHLLLFVLYHLTFSERKKKPIEQTKEKNWMKFVTIFITFVGWFPMEMETWQNRNLKQKKIINWIKSYNLMFVY